MRRECVNMCICTYPQSSRVLVAQSRSCMWSSQGVTCTPGNTYILVRYWNRVRPSFPAYLLRNTSLGMYSPLPVPTSEQLQVILNICVSEHNASVQWQLPRLHLMPPSLPPSHSQGIHLCNSINHHWWPGMPRMSTDEASGSVDAAQLCQPL